MSRANINQVVNIGFESTQRVAATPTRRSVAMQIAFDPKVTTVPFAATGYKVNTILGQGEEWTEGTITSIGNFEELQYILDSVYGIVAPTSPGTGIVRRRVWTPPAAGDTVTPRTLTLDKGDYAASPRAERVVGAQLTDLSMSWDRQKIDFTSKFFGLALDKTVTMGAVGTNASWLLTGVGTISAGTFTLTYNGVATAAIAFNATPKQIQDALNIISTAGGEAFFVSGNQATFGTGAIFTIKARNNLAGVVAAAMTGTFAGLTGGTSSTVTNVLPGTAGVSELNVHQALPKNMTIYCDDTFANIGTTIMGSAYAGTVGITGRFGPTWPVNAANTSYKDSVELMNKAAAQITFEADSVGTAFFDTMRSGGKKFVRLAITGRTLESGFTEKIWIDMATAVLQPNPFADTQGVYTIPWDFDIENDSDFGGFNRVTIDNDLTGN